MSRNSIILNSVLAALGLAGGYFFIAWGPPPAGPPGVIENWASELSFWASVGCFVLFGVGGLLAAYHFASRRTLKVWPFAVLGIVGTGCFAAATFVFRSWHDLARNLPKAALLFLAIALSGSVGSALWRKAGAKRGSLFRPAPGVPASISVAVVQGYLVAGIVLAYGCLLTRALGFESAGFGGSGTYLWTAGLIPVSWVLVEETGFRLLGAGLILRRTGRRSLALLVPAILWAAIHADIFETPISGTGLVLTGFFGTSALVGLGLLIPVGLLYGAAVLRFGLVSSLTASYVATIAVLFPRQVYPTVIAAAVPAAVALPGAFIWLAVLVRRLRRGREPEVKIELATPEMGYELSLLRTPPPGRPGPAGLIGDGSFLVLVARKGEGLVGYLAIRKSEAAPAEVVDIFVSENERRRYVGRRLFTEAREILAVEGRRALRAVLPPGELSAAFFFEAVGLEASETVFRTPSAV